MENRKDIIQWLQTMAYCREVPESIFNSVYTKSTAFIWDELIHTIKPKQEVNNIINNIIFNRLRNKPLHKQNEFSYPIKNIQLFIRKKTLERQLNFLRVLIDEKKHKIQSQSKSNKIEYMTLEKLISNIRNIKERQYLLKEKCQMLETDINNAEETLTFAKNLTPIELDENPNAVEITKTLQKCAEKLEELVKNIPINQNPCNSTSNSFRFYSSRKQEKSIFEKRTVMSEQKYLSKNSVLKHNGKHIDQHVRNKENIDSSKKINKNLFGDTTEHNRTNHKRESLGILSPSCINDNELNYIATIASNSFSEVFSSDVYTLETNNVPSIKIFETSYSLRVNEQYSARKLPKSFNSNSLYTNEFVTNELCKLLSNHNRQVIWITLNNMVDNDIMEAIAMDYTKDGINKSINREDIAKLQFLHVQSELQAIKLKAILQDLLNKIMKKKREIYAIIRNKQLPSDKMEDIKRIFELRLDDICLDTALGEMKKEKHFLGKIEDNRDLHATIGKINQVRKEIITKIENIKEYIDTITKILQNTNHIREMTLAYVRRLTPFVENLDWSMPLTQDVHCNEMSIFEKFPLQYNRRCIYTNSKSFYRNIIGGTINDTLDTDGINMFCTILESPFNPLETVVLNILKSKMKLYALKSLNEPHFPDFTRYSLSELEAQDSYIQYALDKLSSIISSSSAKRILGTSERTKILMEIWLEMPLKDFIPPNRTVEGHEYKFYEKQFDSFHD